MTTSLILAKLLASCISAAIGGVSCICIDLYYKGDK